MKESTQKEKVLKNIRDALVNAMDVPFKDVDMDEDVYLQPSPDSLDIVFAEEFSKTNGKFIYCANSEELSNALLGLLRERRINSLFCADDFFDGMLEEYGITCYYDTVDITRCDASITTCEVLVSRLGSIVVSSKQGNGRQGFIFSPIHIVVASTRQLVKDINGAIQFLFKRYGTTWPSMISFITGPSQTIDIENTPIYGPNGPADIFLFLLDADGEEK
jgi:L-lactate dehydrogenase complex protein LldG